MPSFLHFNRGLLCCVQLPSWHQWVNGELALYRFDALPRSLSPVTGRLLLAIKRYSNGAKKERKRFLCGIFQTATRTIWPHITRQAIVVIIIILHGPEAVNCAANLTTSGQTWDETRRGDTSDSSKSKTDLKLPICIKSTRWWVDSNSNSGGDQAQCLSNAICKLSMAATDDLTIDNAHLSMPRPTFLSPPLLLSLSLSHKQRMMVYR